MQILKKRITPDKTKIQLENWNDDYNFMEYGCSIGAYPISKMSGNSQFDPERGQPFRLHYEFETHMEAMSIFNKLVTGDKTLKDIERYLWQDKYKSFI